MSLNRVSFIGSKLSSLTDSFVASSRLLWVTLGCVALLGTSPAALAAPAPTDAGAGAPGAEPAAPEPAPVEAAPGDTSSAAPGESATPVSEPAAAEPAPAAAEPAAAEPAALPAPVSDDEAMADEAAAPPRSPSVPKHKLIYSNLIIARVNPLGLFNGFTLGYRYRLFDKPDSKLLRDSFLSLSITPNLSPAIAQIGPMIEFQPLAILKLSATYFFTGYFGTFEYFQSFKDQNSNYSDSLQDLRKDNGENYANYSHQFELKALLQAKFGPVAVRSTVLGYYNRTRVEDPNHNAWYSVKYDLLMPKYGWMIGNESDLIYVSKFGLVAGARYNLNHVLRYVDADLGNPNGPMQRLGPLLAYTFWDKPHKKFNKPTLILIAQWWLQHRYRTGAEVSQALPWIVIAFAFSGDLWTSDQRREQNQKRAQRRAEQRRARAGLGPSSASSLPVSL